MTELPDKSRQLAILLFPDVELLDFAGPHEVFTIANRGYSPPAFSVFTVAQSPEAVRTNNGLFVVPDACFANCPSPDIVLVPGGIGTRAMMENDVTLEWLATTTSNAELVLSVCTGALLLAKLGLLADRDVTTHRVAFDLIDELEPTCRVQAGQPFVDSGAVVTSAGIATGIEMSLHIVERLLGCQAANATATHMEYQR